MPFTSYGVSPLFYDRKEEREEEGQKVKVLLSVFRLMQIQADGNSTNRLMLNEKIENALLYSCPHPVQIGASV